MTSAAYDPAEDAPHDYEPEVNPDWVPGFFWTARRCRGFCRRYSIPMVNPSVSRVAARA